MTADSGLPIRKFDEKVALAGIPENMQHPRHRRWFLYKVYWEMGTDGEWKLIKYPMCLSHKPWDNPTGWCYFDEICEEIRAVDKCMDKLPAPIFRYWPGYPITEDVNMIFVDLDHCFLENGELTPTAHKYLDRTQKHSYVEKSISGNGLHILSWFTGNRRKFTTTTPETGVEMYLKGRGVLITGDVFHG